MLVDDDAALKILKGKMGCPILVLPTAVSTLGGLVFGYELGIISGALMQLQAQFHLTCVQQETVVSALLIGAVFASVIGGWLIDHHGRRTSILLSNLLILGGSLILSSSSSFMMLVVGRLLVGFAMSISSMSCCIFVSEMVPSNRRGLMVTLYEAGVTVGILVAYAVNYILSGAQDGWRYMFGFAIAPCLAQLASVWVLPSRHVSLVQLIPESQSCSDGAEEGASSQEQTEKKRYTILHLFQREDNMRTRMMIGLGLVLFQQFTGQPNVLFYASTIFRSVGFRDYASAVLASVGLGIVKVISTSVAMLCADKAGRRLLLISGCSVMALGLIFIGFLSRNSLFDTRHCSSEMHPNDTILPENLTELVKITNDTSDAGAPRAVGNFNWLILICMMSVVSAFSVGFGPMTWLVLSEIFPADMRGRAFAFTNCFNWVANLIVTFSFLSVIDVIGLSGVFFIYGVIAVAAVVFIYFLLPETKGKSLHDIDKELCERRFPHREEFCRIFRRCRSPGYQRVSWGNSSL
ncbi:solute carrier family 2, facilitated glucose transporter member 10 [Colossoma macropomum]|uniref:solute carrier family 2, facilitated glucose transporter member 10 n=1 Tax=Colossoma macropomum TaxID=42526 RepID=UPI001864B70E|nr:solute carrier family 2, facilitated glucose transporter member 10 [Colossoma macropomum]